MTVLIPLEFKEENTGSAYVDDVCESTGITIGGLSEAADVLNGGGHGAMFHLAMITYYHLITGSEYAEENSEYVIKDIEASRRIFMYKSTEQTENMAGTDLTSISGQNKPAHSTLRYVDIVLAKKGATALNNTEVWVELKSYKAKGKSDTERKKTVAQGFNLWQLGKESKEQCRNSSLNKQFIHDRIAKIHGVHSTKSGSENGDKYIAIPVSGIQWWFHKFKTEVKGKTSKTVIRTDISPKLGSYTVKGNIKERLTAFAKGKYKRIIRWNMFGKTSGELTTLNSTYRTEAKNGSYSNGQVIGMASIKSLLIDTMYNNGLIPGDKTVYENIKAAMPDPD